LPWPREDASRFSSIHSDPPWQTTEDPEITRHRFGEGEAIYCASLIENLENAEDALLRLVRMLHSDYQYEVDAPQCVEVTLFSQPDRKRYLLSLLNFQKELPNLPVDGIRVRLNVAEPIVSVKRIPSGQAIKLTRTEKGVQFDAPRLETLVMIEANYGTDAT
jgi:hypothetical protein